MVATKTSNRSMIAHPIEDVFRFADDLLGWPEAATRSFIRANWNKEGAVYDQWDISDWTSVTDLIRTYWAWEDAQHKLRPMPHVCPICGGPIKREPMRNGMFHWLYGWRCIAPSEDQRWDVNDHFTLASWWNIFFPFKGLPNE